MRSSCLTAAGGCGSLPQSPVASRFYGVKGGGGVRPEGVASLSLPSGRVPPSPVQPAPPSPGPVASPYQSVGGEPVETNSFRMTDNSSPVPLLWLRSTPQHRPCASPLPRRKDAPGLRHLLARRPRSMNMKERTERG